MKIANIYSNIIKDIDKWNYYNEDIEAPCLTNKNDCCNFIKEFIKYSEKSGSCLFKNIEELKRIDPKRLYHIVSSFFLGLWFFYNRKKLIHNSIFNELRALECFCNYDNKEINRQFIFVWYMATLFHDLGYIAEYKGKMIPDHNIPYKFNGSIPHFYVNVFRNYYKYRENKEHGIYAGLIFDRDICKIREYQEKSDKSDLNWSKDLEELYHYVAWIILAHNIWLKRDNDANINEYREKGLDQLILSSELKDNNLYKEYITFVDYPLFAFFCIIDTIEPIKSTSCFSKVDIKLERDKIIIKSNDSNYRKQVLSLNEWLVPTIENDNTVTIFLQDDNTI